MKNFNLSQQLICIIIIIFGIITSTIGYLFPKVLLPVFENNIYFMLKQPLDLINSNAIEESLDQDVTFLYITNNGNIVASDNLKNIIKLSPRQIINKLKDKQGKFTFLGKTYYYLLDKEENITKIALTNDNYINNIKKNIDDTIFPILLCTMLIVVGLVLLWSQLQIRKIEAIKAKIDNLDNDNYKKIENYYFNDELHSLSVSIDDMKTTLKVQDEYKNQMYQNISHDFKTPLTVIKSYIEGIEDGIQEPEDGIKIIEEQVDKLEQKVHSLLYLNKLNYIKELDSYKNETTDVSKVIETSVKKFKAIRPDINWEVSITDKKVIYRGTYDMWEAIIDNLLNNFVRYAEKSIKISIKNSKIRFFNDGPNIDPNILNDIFTPYKKGIKGQFGLGLSIVKKTIMIFGYEISVHNEKKGISFIIK
ncbi:MAG: HAMP domain-containing sensor histidine kinase [Bacilli bacterium]